MCRTKIELERYFTGDLAPADADRVRRHISECADCGAKIAALETDKIRYLNLYPFEEFARKERIGADRSVVRKIVEFFRTPWSMQLYGGAAVATFLLLLLIPVYYAPDAPDDPASPAVSSNNAAGIRYKGPTAASEADGFLGGAGKMSFLYRRDGAVNFGGDDYIFKDGDSLMFRYSHDVKHHAALFSIDNMGTVSFYTDGENGADGVVSILSDPGDDLTFPLIIMLDDVGEEELIVALISDASITDGEVSAWVKKMSKDGFGDLSRIEKILREDGMGARASVEAVRIRKE